MSLEIPTLPKNPVNQIRMKKIILSGLAILCMLLSFAQSKQYMLFEHFTQASCLPCADQNPAFEAVRSANLGNTHHIAYHTTWPGVDPMNDFNPTDVAAMVSYYSVSSVPDMNMLGMTWNGGPAGVSQDQIDAAGVGTSPVRLRVTDNDLGSGTHEVLVELMETGEIQGGNLKLRVALVEGHIDYSNPPGTNGETSFPNVMREMLSTPAGSSVTVDGVGTVQEFTYSYEEDPAYVPSELYVLAWLQDDQNGVVLNSGSSNDPIWQMVNGSPGTIGSGSAQQSFAVGYNSDGTEEEVLLELTSDAPVDWNGSFTADGVNYTSGSAVIEIPNGSMNFEVNVVPGSSAAIGTYTLTISSVSYPNDPPTSITYTVISGVTDLILSNAYVDGAGTAFNWDEDYTSGLDEAGNSSYAVMGINKFVSAVEEGALDEVNNIYYNISWTFPSFTVPKVAALSSFLDSGKNMFVSGQDVGWDTWDPAGNGNVETQEFYTNYLSAQYDFDGNAANNQLTWTGDVVFDQSVGSSIVNAYTGGAYLYPDELTPLGNAVSVFNYNGDASKSGCVRVDENGHKIVYMGIDTRMIADEAVRDQVIAISHDWFYGIISSLEYDIAIRDALGQNYPNPAMTSTLIPLNELKTDARISVVDINGRIVHEGQVAAGQKLFELNVEGLISGSYLYYLSSAEGRSEAIKFQVE